MHHFVSESGAQRQPGSHRSGLGPLVQLLWPHWDSPAQMHLNFTVTVCGSLSPGPPDRTQHGRAWAVAAAAVDQVPLLVVRDIATVLSVILVNQRQALPLPRQPSLSSGLSDTPWLNRRRQ